MLENRDWAGGRRDRGLVLDPERVAKVETVVDEVLAAIKDGGVPGLRSVSGMIISGRSVSLFPARVLIMETQCYRLVLAPR